jgi:hypothetical protein
VRERPVTPWTVGKTYNGSFMELADERDDPVGQALRTLHAAMELLYETMPPAFAHQFATDARDEADRNYRMRQVRS